MTTTSPTNHHPHPSTTTTTTTTTTTSSSSSAYLLPTLRNIYTKALTNTLLKCSYPAFAACFPTPAARKPETLKTVWKQIVGKIETKALAEFEAVVRERELDGRFKELEGLLGEAKDRDKGVGLHSLSPMDLWRATMAPCLGDVGRRLDEETRGQRGRNEGLVGELVRKRAEIEGVVEALEGVVRDMEGANGILYAASKDMGDVEMDEG